VFVVCLWRLYYIFVLTFRWIFATAAPQQEEQEEDDQDFEIDEEEEQEEPPPPINNNRLDPPPAPPTRPAPPPSFSTRIMAPSATASRGGITWMPIHEKHAYRLDGYDRLMYIIDMPASFSGKPGSYKMVLRDKELELSVPSPPPLTDPHHVHSFLTDSSGRIFSEDSCKRQNWLEHVKALRSVSSDPGKIMWVFKDSLPFKIQRKVANDLPHKGKMFTELTWEDKKTGETKTAKVLILELKGTEEHQYESEEEEELEMGTFKSPEKIVGTGGDLAQIARAMEKLMRDNPGKSLDDCLQGAVIKKKRPPVPRVSTAMVVDGENSSKRAKEAVAGLKRTGEEDVDEAEYDDEADEGDAFDE
jgi:hypothetical protein